jgi:hypothetical protein
MKGTLQSNQLQFGFMLDQCKLSTAEFRKPVQLAEESKFHSSHVLICRSLQKCSADVDFAEASSIRRQMGERFSAS